MSTATTTTTTTTTANVLGRAFTIELIAGETLEGRNERLARELGLTMDRIRTLARRNGGGFIPAWILRRDGDSIRIIGRRHTGKPATAGLTVRSNGRTFWTQ